MNSIIFCEGRTDAVLIGQYLIKKSGWQYDNKSKNGFVIEKEDAHQIINRYKRGEDFLYIWGVGGRTRFERPINRIIAHNEIADKPYNIDNFIILVDRDECEDDNSICIEFNKCFTCCTLTNESWVEYQYVGGFEKKNTAKALLLIIPFDETGALETVMINALGENEEDSIVSQSCSFIDGLETTKYLQKRRDKLKAKLSTIVSVICPDRAVDSLVEIVEGIDWCKYKQVNRVFEKLLEV